jgi:LysR family transcriptional regulator for metE and metH
VVLEVRHLRIVEAISRTGTVSGAARIVHLTQPAISHALAELERRLRLRLFHRTARGMDLTSEGRRILDAAHVVLDELRKAEHDLGLVRAGEAGHLTVTTQCYTCYHWLPDVLRSFRLDFPGIDVQILPEGAEMPFRYLDEGKADLAIVYESPAPEGIVTEELFRDELMAIVPPSHPAARRRRLRAADFAGETLVLHSNPSTSAIMAQVLAPAKIAPREILQVKLTEAVIAFVKAGLGITVMPRWAASPALDDRELLGVPIGADGLYRTWFAAYPARRKGARALRAFVECLRAHPFVAAVDTRPAPARRKPASRAAPR